MRKKHSLLLLVSIAAFASACSSAPSATPSVPPVAGGAAASVSASSSTSSSAHLSGSATQTSDAAGVTIAVTWAGPSAGAVFEVQMDNHMIDLGSVDLTKATLTNDRGERLSSPASQGGSSGHHRDDKLTFGPSSTAFLESASWVQLELPAVGDNSPRDFKWNLS